MVWPTLGSRTAKEQELLRKRKEGEGKAKKERKKGLRGEEVEGARGRHSLARP